MDMWGCVLLSQGFLEEQVLTMKDLSAGRAASPRPDFRIADAPPRPRQPRPPRSGACSSRTTSSSTCPSPTSSRSSPSCRRCRRRGNLTNLLSNVWPLLAVAIGQTFVLIIAGIDLSQGAIMGLASVAGAVVIADRRTGSLLGGSPLWGTLARPSRAASSPPAPGRPPSPSRRCCRSAR